MTSVELGRPRGPVTLAAVCVTAFVVLSVLVATRTTQHLDVAARDFFRPGDEWGPVQLRADLVVEGLKPRNIAPLLALVGLVASLRQRSWRPAVYAALMACAAGALALFTKLLLQRPNPHYEMDGIGGAFPSGHMVTVLVCLGGAVLVVLESSRWWQWAFVALVGLAMGIALLVQAAHWFTDVAGGALLGVTALATASLSRLRGPPR